MSTAYDEIKGELEAALKKGEILAINAFSKKIREMDSKSKAEVRNLVYKYVLDPNIQKSILFDFGIDFHKQEQLLEKILKYLEHEIARLSQTIENYKNTEDYKNRMEVIGKLKNHPDEALGECVGLSTCWATGKRIEDEPKSKASVSARDDTVFFYETWKKLVLWDEKTEFSKSEKTDIERFISNMRLYQNRAFYIFNEGKMQLDLSITLSDTKRGSPVQTFEDNIPCTKEMLELRLEKLVKPKSMIFVSCTSKEGGHMMAVYQNESDQKIYFFNPNADEGEVFVTTMKQLGEEIWEGSDPESFAKAMSGWDPIDKEFRQDIEFAIFRFPADPEYQYPSKKEFRVSTSEFLKTIQENVLLRYKWNSEKGKALIGTLGEDEIIDLLNDKNTDAEIKSILVGYVFLNNENQTPYLARYILTEQKQFIEELLKKNIITENSVGSLKVLASQFVDLNKQNLSSIFEKKRYLTSSEVFLFLGDNPGKLELVEKFLQHSAFYVSRSLGFGLFSAVKINLEHRDLEIAKKLLVLADDKFNGGLSVHQLEKLGNPEIAEFLYEKYDQFYQNVWGSSALKFLPQKINYQNIQHRKKKMMESAVGLLSNQQQQNKMVEELSEKALGLKSSLTLDEALIILSVVSGDSNLAKELLNNCIKDDMAKGFGLVLAVRANLDRGDFEIAKTIVNIVFERFKQGLSLQSIEGLGNEEFAKFMYENYGDYYPNKFGQSELFFMPFIIATNREHAKKRTEVMNEITDLLKPDVEKNEKSIIEATDHAVKIAKLLTLSDVLTVLALKPSDKVLAKKLLDICMEQHRSIDHSYLDKEKFARVLELNMNNPELAKLVIETVASEFDIKGFVLCSGKDFGNEINTYMRELVLRRNETARRVTDENIIEVKKLQEIADKTKLEKEQKDLRKIRYASDIFTEHVSDLKKNLVKDHNRIQNSVESKIEIMRGIQPREITFLSFEEARSDLLWQYKYSIKYILEQEEEMNRHLKNAQSFKNIALELLIIDNPSDEILSEINGVKRTIAEQMLKAEQEVQSSIDGLWLLQRNIQKEYDSLKKELDHQESVLKEKKQELFSMLNKAHNEFLQTNLEIDDVCALTLKTLNDLMSNMQKRAKDNPEGFLLEDILQIVKIADDAWDLIDTKLLQINTLKLTTFENVVKVAYGNQLMFEPGMDVAIMDLHNQQATTKQLSEKRKSEISKSREKTLEFLSHVMREVDEKEMHKQHEQFARNLEEERERQLQEIEEERKDYLLRFSKSTVQKTNKNDNNSTSGHKPEKNK